MGNHPSTNNNKPRRKRKKRGIFGILFVALILFMLYAFHNFGGLGLGNNGDFSSKEEPSATQTIACNIELTNENTILYQDDTFSSVEQFIQLLKDTYPDNLSSLEIIIHDDKANQNFYTSVDVALTEASISHRVAD